MINEFSTNKTSHGRHSLGIVLLLGIAAGNSTFLSADGNSKFKLSSVALTETEARSDVSHILRVQDLVDGILSRLATRLDTDTKELKLDGGKPTRVDRTIELDLAPAVPPDGAVPPGGPMQGGTIPSTLAALVATTGKLTVRIVGHAITNNDRKTASYDLLLTAKTDIVLTDAADSKTITVKQGTVWNYGFVWSLAADGSKTYASTGNLQGYPTTVAKQGQKLSLVFASTFDIAVSETADGKSTVNVRFDDTVTIEEGESSREDRRFDPVFATGHYFRLQFKIDDLPSAGGSTNRVLRAGTYEADGVGLAFNIPASEI